MERGGEVEVVRESIFDYLGRETRRLRRPAADLPFDFDCGFVGYLGYELKAACDGDAAHEVPTPDAAFVFADRLVAFDHLERRTYVLCVTDPDGAAEGGGGSRRRADDWRRCRRSLTLGRWRASTDAEPVDFHLSRSRERYLDDIDTCKRRLFGGETYEVCLTNKITAEAGPDPVLLYRALRRANPAPFAAFLRFGEVAVLSSSPERFLRSPRDRWAEARPIKGTRRRGETAAEDARLAAELAADEKSRAENVTIVDLLRNDLGIVCEVGTVEVPELMWVETYETVHQLVSSVRGRLREGLDAPDCIRACFPARLDDGSPEEAHDGDHR